MPTLSCSMVPRRRSDRRKSYLPISLAGFRCYQDGVDEAWAHISLRNVEKDDTQVVEIRVHDMQERPVAELEGLTVRLLPLDKVQPNRAAADDVFYRVAWRKSVRSAVNPGGSCSGKLADLRRCKRCRCSAGQQTRRRRPSFHLVYRGGSFARQDPRKWTANERQPRRFSPVAGAIRC